tara:strand:+ start:392 stop:553 length:162 start_codon:yes stop_codon:yes gene_type:complete
MNYIFTFDNAETLELTLTNTNDTEIRQQLDYEISQGWHEDVTSDNMYTYSEAP